jgi:hypothetical protein
VIRWVTHPMDAWLTDSERGPVLVWLVEDAGITADALCAISGQGRIYFPAMTITGISEDVSSSDQLRAVPVTSMLTAANGRFRRDILAMFAAHGDETAAALLEGAPKAEEAPARTRAPVMRFRMIPAGRKPDRFYESVATAYEYLVTEKGSRRPALELAERNDVPVTTVHRWITEARRRGLLGPGVKGRAGL